MQQCEGQARWTNWWVQTKRRQNEEEEEGSPCCRSCRQSRGVTVCCLSAGRVFVLLLGHCGWMDGWMSLMKPGQAPGVFHKWDNVILIALRLEIAL